RAQGCPRSLSSSATSPTKRTPSSSNPTHGAIASRVRSSRRLTITSATRWRAPWDPGEEKPAPGLGGRLHPAWPASARTTAPAVADSAFTRRTVTWPLAPEELPLPVGLGLQRVARAQLEPIRYHAAALTGALHVPLHLLSSAAPAWHRRPLVCAHN